ncbi:hypothetical protein [Myxosarcina sp. GI1]|uniref:PFE-CTERM domain-containing protein n=1 Tax=Myxosarcina sp. GI1 TaxID=1541065 RepID=UPI00056D25CE|nr:hypothetical protein [Myxosarcina sp. GI1]
MNNLITKITLSTLITSITALATITSASAFSFSLTGTFEETYGGTISGTFELYEPTLSGDDYQCSNIDITTTAGSEIFAGSNYTDSSDNAFLSSCSADGFAMSLYDEASGNEFFLDLQSESSLVDLAPSETAQINPATTYEQYFDGFGDPTTRYIASGTVTAAVPFEFSPTLGLLLVGGAWGINRLRKSRNKIE